MIPAESSPWQPTRRHVLRGGASAVAASLVSVAATSCGPLRIGGPATYTPPPPGIDELYRREVLAMLDHLNTQVTATHAQAEPVVMGEFATYARALPLQREALRTAAESELAEEEARKAAYSPEEESPAGNDPDQLTAQDAHTQWMRVRDAAWAGSLQVSGTLAHPIAAIGAYAHWAATRMHAIAEVNPDPALTPDASPPELRDVPADDPPVPGSADDYERALITAQEHEWYAGYVCEVLAAQVSDAPRERLLEKSGSHRERAQALADLALGDGCTVVPRHAVYPMPTSSFDSGEIAQWPLQLDRAILSDHLAVIASAPFASRELSARAALVIAADLAPVMAELEPVPSLHPKPGDVFST